MNWTSDTPVEIYLDWLEDQGEDVTQLRMLNCIFPVCSELMASTSRYRMTTGWLSERGVTFYLAYSNCISGVYYGDGSLCFFKHAYGDGGV